MRDRRAYVIWVSPQDIVNLFHNWRQPGFVVMVSLTDCRDPAGNRVRLPTDAVVDGACYDWLRQAIGLRLTHDSFPEVPDGAETPTLVLVHTTFEVVPARQDTEDGPIIVGG